MPAMFQADTLRASLSPLAALQPLSTQAKAYQRFYGLDLPERKKRTVSGLGRFEAAGFELVAQLWRPEAPVATLFLLHGFYDHMGLYRHVIDWALDQGFAVISCDLPGHGLSSGERASIGDFNDYQRVLEALFEQARNLALPTPWHLCGQSTGGAIAIDHLLHQGIDSPIKGEVILLAPLVRPRAWGWLKFSYRLLRPFVKGIARRFSENTNDPTFLPFLQTDPLQPRRLPTAWVGALLAWVRKIEAAPSSTRSPMIIQGQADMTVDWPYNLAVLEKKFAAPRILMLPQARHHLANELPAIRERYFGFLTQHLGV
ncbi:alpha/beta hydrolase [Pseudomonas sp. R5(2019)]|uniref:alpha/beta hydrolase n=1 Tax=Pseudomonas sp. R5(2019) TaxID=2697566 RepID=UPI00141359CB|nr:alpha/beta hydrolase [Pseudomonas sp. R5(2019)]NBA97879.1 alpha/beta fold hydrolase [Pseudomonas sp. R5(2019)]